jgi:TolB protein
MALTGAVLAVVVAASGFGAVHSAARNPAMNTAKIAFGGRIDGRDDLFLVNPDGSGFLRLTHNTTHDDNYPSWSPNHRRMAFSDSRDDTSGSFLSEIYVADANGSHGTRLTHLSQKETTDPAWSPNGKKIAFNSISDGDRNRDLYTMNANGSGIRRLTTVLGEDIEPTWSSDSRRIAFGTFPEGIYVINADGSEEHLISATGSAPAWSPDGAWIAYENQHNDSFHSEIYLMHPDGTHRRRLTHNADSDFGNFDPAWSPDGKRIAFRSTVNGNGILWTVGRDGRGLKRVISVKGLFSFAGVDW